MTMQRSKDSITGRFDEGQDLHEAYKELAREQDVTAGIVVSGIGMLQDPELGYFVGDGEYDRHTLEGNYELLSTQGNLAQHDGEPFTHLHVVLGDQEHNALGGHLFTGTIKVAHEFNVKILPHGSLQRRDDPNSGLLKLCPE